MGMNVYGKLVNGQKLRVIKYFLDAEAPADTDINVTLPAPKGPGRVTVEMIKIGSIILFVPNAPFLYPSQNIRKPYGFLMFSGSK